MNMDGRDHFTLTLQSCLLLLLLALTLGYSQYQIYTKEREVRDGAINRNLALMQMRADAYLERLVLDADFIAHSPILRMYLQRPSAETLTGVQDSLLTLSVLRNYFDQVRYIDQQGVERVRVDYRDGTARLADGLQDKSDRDYVQAGLALSDGEVYLSEIDLNIEHGRIEQPYRPMIRAVARAMVDGQGAGMIVLNARADDLVRRLQVVLRGTDEQLVMLNSEGGWITGGGEHDWQFTLNPDARLAVQEPALWATIQANSAGQFEYQGQCHDYRWYHFKLRQVQSPRLLIAQRAEGQGCDYVASQAVKAWAWKLTLISAVVLPLFGLWQFSRLRARVLRRGLRESNAQLDLITREADLGLLMVDHQCRVCWINPEAERLLGWDAAELIGENLHEKVHVTAHGGILHTEPCPTLRALETGQRYRSDDERLLNRSGDVVCVSIRVSPYGEAEQRKAIVTLADTREFVAREQRLVMLATTDELTGALNRRSILQNLQVLLDDPQARPCVLIVDIDFFKRVNDTYGHAAGDRVLVSFADTIRNLLRKGDLLGRLGGEEFVVVLGSAGLPDAKGLAERLRAAVAESNCLSDDDTPIAVTASFGLALHDGQESLKQLLARADEALYRAKHSGRNRVEVA